jgi:hypothetical protein
MRLRTLLLLALLLNGVSLLLLLLTLNPLCPLHPILLLRVGSRLLFHLLVMDWLEDPAANMEM